MLKGDLEIKDSEYDVGEINLINWRNIPKHIQSILKASKFKLDHCSIITEILTFMFYSVVLDIPNLINKLSHGL